MTKFLNIGASVYNALKDITGIKVYPLVADNDAKYPFAVYRRSNLITGYSKDGLHQTTASMEITLVAEKYSQSIEKAQLIADKLKGIELEGYSLEVKWTNASESYDGQAFIQSLSFDIVITLL